MRRNEEPGTKETKEAIARVNGQPVLRDRLDLKFDQGMGQVAMYQAFGQTVGLEQLARFRLQAFNQAVMDELLLKQAATEGITVSGRDVEAQAEKIADQQLEQLRGQYKGPDLEPALGRLVATVEKKQSVKSMSARSFRKWMLNRLVDQSSDEIRDDLTMQKLREKVTAGVAGNEQDLMASYDRMHIREILVSLHPAGKPARTDDEARKRAEEVAAKAKQGADFAALATAESDDPAGKKSGGSQPMMMLSGYPPELQQAMANLKPGEVSQPAKTGAGYAIVKVEGRTRELPKDFEKNKPQLLASFVQRRQSQAWDAYQQTLHQSAKIDVTDPEILAYQAIEQNKQKDALTQMQKAATEAGKQRGLVGAIIYYNLAMMYAVKNQWKEAADNFSNAADTVTQDQKQSLPDARAQALLGLAQADEKLGKKDESLNMYQEASNWADMPGVHSQLVGVYQRLGKPDLAKKEQDWLVQYQQQQAEKQKAMLQQQQQAATAPKAAQPAGGRAPVQGKPAAQAPAASRPGGATPAQGPPVAKAPATPKPAAQTAPQPVKRGG
jgi:parvulin-like peptidyl-prolyl isomerase